MKKMTSLQLLAMFFGVCGNVMCPKKPVSKPGAQSSAMVVYQKPKPMVDPNYADDAADALTTTGGDNEAARLQAAIQNIGEYADEIAQALSDMTNALGAAQEKSAETVAALSTSANDLSADVQRASTRLDVVVGAQQQ